MKWFLDLLAAAEGLYWLIGVFVVLGGFAIFVGEMIALVMKRRRGEKEITGWVLVKKRRHLPPRIERPAAGGRALDVAPPNRTLPAAGDVEHE